MSGIVVLLLLWVSFASALVVHKSVTLHSLTDFEQFGFALNGEIQLTVSFNPPQQNVSVLICTDKQFDLLSSYADPNDLGYCTYSGLRTCEYTVDYRTNIDYKVMSRNRYHLVLVQCGPKDLIKAYVRYTLLNPGGEQLPLGEIPLPDLYILITCIWAVLVALCGLVWLKNRQYVVMLHGLLSSVGVLKLAVVIVALCYWHVFKTTGRDLVQLKYFQSFIYALSETAFFCALLLISKGWRITRSNLPPSEIRTISVALVLLLSTLLFFSFYNDGYYFLSLMIMYFFMLPKIFTSITRNTRALHTHMLLARYANVELNSEPVLAKIRMFKALRTAVILYLGSILIISSMKIIMWWFLVWVTYCVSELVTIVMIVAVCILTRPRLNGVFSPRSYFEGGSFPILNMQQFDHFDELFGDQIWDPDMVFGNNAAAIAAASGQPHIDVSEALVIEYPVPSFSKEEEATNYFPRLAIAMPEKEKEKESGGGNGGMGGSGEGGDKENILRRRGVSSSSSSSSSSSFSSSAYLASSTSALLPPESPSLVSSASSTPLLVPSPLSPSIHYEGLELEEMNQNNQNSNKENKNEKRASLTLTNTATQTSPTISPSPALPSSLPSFSTQNPSFPSSSSSSSTTTTTTTTTTSQPTNEITESPITKKRTFSNADKNNKEKEKDISNKEKEKTKERDKASSDGVTTTSTTSSTPSSSSPPPSPSCTTTITPETPPRSLSQIETLSSPVFTSTSSLLSKVEKEERWKGDDDEEELL